MMHFESFIFRKFVLPLTLLVFIAFSACAKSNNDSHSSLGRIDIQGVWTGTAQQTGSPNPTFTLQLNTKDDGEVWGSITSMDGTFVKAIISGGRTVNSKIFFSATANGTNSRQGRSFSFEADVTDGKMEGIWKDILERTWGPFTLERQDNPQESAHAPEH